MTPSAQAALHALVVMGSACDGVGLVTREHLRTRARQEEMKTRASNFIKAMEQLYAERMARTTNLATVRCPDGDVALARRLVADQLTFEADMDRRFPAWAAGLLAGAR